MKKLAPVLVALLIFVPFVSFAAPLTQTQAESLIGVVQASPGTPASAFTNLITAFSNITVAQADSLIGVVQAAPGVAANAFVNLLVSFTQDTQQVATTQTTTTNTSSYPNSCNGTGSPACPSGYHFYCPSSGAGYCLVNSTIQTAPQTTTAPPASQTTSSGSASTSGTNDSTAPTSQAQQVSPSPAALSVALSSNAPVNDTVSQSQVNVPVGNFTFTAQGSSYLIKILTLRVPTDATAAISEMTVNYPAGNSQISDSQPSIVTMGNGYTDYTYRIGMNVPANGSAQVGFYASISADATPGTAIQATLDTGTVETPPTFLAEPYMQNDIWEVNGGDSLTSNGTYTVESLADYKKSLGL